jgi:signal transduction histidine kinase
MNLRLRRPEDATSPAGRRSTRRVALAATVLVLVVYLLSCAVADLVAVRHLEKAMDVRLAERIDTLTESIPSRRPPSPVLSIPPISGDGDLDDAPVIAWWVPQSTATAVRLDTGSPALPLADQGVARPRNVTIGGKGFRLTGVTIQGGRIVAATSTREITSATGTLTSIEAVLAPIVLVTFFLAALIIARRAVAPVERARQRQLEMTADASHELRTPLSVIEAEVGLALSARRSAAGYRGALESVSSETARLRHIVEDLLWLARVDALPLLPPGEAVDLGSLAEVCADRFSAVASRRGVTISVSVERRRSPIVFGPAEWLDRLISVLLDNACRYTSEQGQVGVTVSTTNDRVRLAVDDSGPGIADDQREHIFRRFHRASAVPGGAGLGLSIANAVVEATGGTWFVDTGPLGGARIAVSWKLSRAGDEPVRRTGGVTRLTTSGSPG